MINRAQIDGALLRAIAANEAGPVATVASQFGLARQTVSKYMRELVEAGHAKVQGKGVSTKYSLVEMSHSFSFDLSQGVSEDTVWEQSTKPFVQHLPKDAYDLCHYGLTEMVNNAIDHSEGSKIDLEVSISSIRVTLCITDNGIGIFQKISTALKLTDPRQSLLEVSKGKFTTDPTKHTGEGIFFTCRSFDFFSLLSRDLALVHNESQNDWFIEVPELHRPGTEVVMRLWLPPTRKLEDVFSKFSSGPEEYRFARTHVPLKLAIYGRDELVSRSQAKRVLSRVERFQEVLLDFSGVEQVGQAFADEIFRVYARANPGIEVGYVYANERVEGMIKRAQNQAK